MAIRHLLTSTVWVGERIGASLDYADPQYGTPYALPCRVDRKNETYRDSAGNERGTTHTITTDQEITLGSMVWFDGCDAGDVSKGYEVAVVRHSQTPGASLGIWEARV